jgi:hypothetical protein
VNRSTLRDVAVFVLLAAIGVVGRLFQPDWSFTPVAAVTIFGAYYFRNWFAAILLPIAVLSVSHQWLPAYESRGVMLAVFASMTAPVALGWMLRRPMTGLSNVVRFAACGIVPAIVFFIVTNAAVWFFNGARLGYDPTLAGLAACYTAAIPFFRTMLAGDVFYLAVLFGTYALATHFATAPERQRS